MNGHGIMHLSERYNKRTLKDLGKEVQIDHRLFLVNCYLLDGNIYSVKQKQIEIEVSTKYQCGRFSDSLKGLCSISIARNNLCIIQVSLDLGILILCTK